ncbi:MAG: magnesium/cobalt transporter CorA [Planctomycetota bacterium]
MNPKVPRLRRAATPPGSSPGTIVVDSKAHPPLIHLIAYGPHEMIEMDLGRPEESVSFLQRFPVTWINVDGLGDAETIRKFGELFGLHRLALEDVANLHQRAKVESYDKITFMVSRMVSLDPDSRSARLETEQLGLFLGENFVLTFQERPGDCFDNVRARIRQSSGRIRSAGPDYLAYALLDAAIDHFFPVLEVYGEKLEQLEDDVGHLRGTGIARRVQAVRNELMTLRRAIWPQREAINLLIREANPLIATETRVHLRDCYDHTVEVIEMLETYREIAAGVHDMYMSSLSIRTSEIMKVLAIIATIFIPLSFLASLYGMNFNRAASPFNMPELDFCFGYPALLFVMLLMTSVQIFLFRKKGWIGKRRGSR